MFQGKLHWISIWLTTRKIYCDLNDKGFMHHKQQSSFLRWLFRATTTIVENFKTSIVDTIIIVTSVLTLTAKSTELASYVAS